jgi:hypothetical protein
LNPDELFTTRDLLHYGPRGAIDQTIRRLIKEETIERVSRGVFARSGGKNQFSPYDIAKLKAESFGRKIMVHAKDVAYKMQLTEEGNKEIVFATNGSSSSFLFNNIRIYFKKTSPRNMELASSLIGDMIRSLAYMGKETCNKSTIYRLIHEASYKPIKTMAEVHDAFQKTNSSAPIWLVNAFPWYKNRECIWHRNKQH